MAAQYRSTCNCSNHEVCCVRIPPFRFPLDGEGASIATAVCLIAAEIQNLSRAATPTRRTLHA